MRNNLIKRSTGVQFIDDASYIDNNSKYIDERYKYASILRATLSPYELVFLYYNGISEIGKKDLKELIEKYSLLNNLRPEYLSDTRCDKNMEVINDNHKSDYERYKTDIKGDLNKYYKSAFEIDQSAFKNKN